MRFDDFDTKMRVYEESLDQKILPDMYMVARLDGRGFSKYTKDGRFEVPFDIDFRNMMLETTKKLMNCGFRIVYGYTQSDEISLLFHKEEKSFGRKTRKYNSVLAGKASAEFSLVAGEALVFDCRMVPLPNKEKVGDYFLWRQADATRNALNGWAYWTLRKDGKSKREATSILAGKNNVFKNELLFKHGINFNELPAWQKRGVGFCYWEIEREGYNPLTKEKVIVSRRELVEDEVLSVGEEYRDFVLKLLQEDE